MSQDKKKSDKQDQPQVVEGEIVDGLAGLEPDPVNGGRLKKTAIYIFVVAIIVALGWWSKPTIEAKLAEFSQNIFGVEENTQQPVDIAKASELANVERTISQLQARITALEGNKNIEEQALIGINDSLDALDQRIAIVEEFEPLDQSDTESFAGQDELQQQINVLEERLSLKEAVPLPQQTEAPSVATVYNNETEFFMTLVHLSRAVTLGRPYKTQLLALETFYAGNYAVADRLSTLKAWSEKGVPTDIDILNAFKSAVLGVVTAETELLELSWWQRVWSDMKGLVTIRKTGEVAGNDVGAIMARAEVRIEDGHYEEALALLRGTSFVEQGAMTDLINMIEGRVSTQTAINELITLGLEGGVEGRVPQHD